jgi:hypothetical protein
MSDALVTYLHDHLAGSHFAIHLLESLEKQHPGGELGTFAQALREEIAEDQKTLEQIIGRVGTGHLDLMEAIGWMAEKASEFKLRRDNTGSGLGTFEALEVLSVGVQGKLALWRVLPVIRETDPRVPECDTDRLLNRAFEQFGRVEEQRLKLARTTFRPAPATQ